MKDVPVLGKWSHLNRFGISALGLSASGVRQVHRWRPFDSLLLEREVFVIDVVLLVCSRVCFGTEGTISADDVNTSTLPDGRSSTWSYWIFDEDSAGFLIYNAIVAMEMLSTIRAYIVLMLWFDEGGILETIDCFILCFLLPFAHRSTSKNIPCSQQNGGIEQLDWTFRY